VAITESAFAPDGVSKATVEPLLGDNCFVNLDMESGGWTVDFDLDVNDPDFQNQCNLIDTIKQCNPCAILGSYSVFPASSLNWIDAFNAGDANVYRCERAEDRANARAWCDKVDYLAPPFYFPYNDINTSWGSYDAALTTFRIMLRDAAIACPDKPIYPLIWRTARFGGATSGTISDTAWSAVMTMVECLADGVFLFAYSVEEENAEPGSSVNIPSQSWFQILQAKMQETNADCANGTLCSRLRHEEACPCLCSEIINITVPGINGPVTLYQSVDDPCKYGAGQDCTSERAYVLEPYSFPGHSGTAESLIEIVFDPATCAMTGEYVLNGVTQQTFGTNSLPPVDPNNCWTDMSVASSGSVTIS